MDLAEFTDNVLTLTAIFAKKDEIGKIEQVYFHFDNTHALEIDVDWDTDEVIIGFGKIQTLGENFIPIFTQFYEMNLIRTWLMTNHKGYQDAIQFEFWAKAGGQDGFFQLQAVASTLYIYELSKT